MIFMIYVHGSFKWYLLMLTFLICILGEAEKVVVGIDCFKCVSIDGDDPSCEDPFHNNYSTKILHSPCWAGRKDRNGVFPASACIKINGIFSDNGTRIMIRDCALDSGTLTTDTELVRMSHCGGFYLDKRYVSGCVQSCFEDACNSAPSSLITIQKGIPPDQSLLSVLSTIIILFFFYILPFR